MSTLCINGLRMIFRMNSDYLLQQHQTIGCPIAMHRFVRCRKWIFMFLRLTFSFKGLWNCFKLLLFI